MPSKLLRYLYYSLRYRWARKLGFIRMGLGTEARYERARVHWKPHLDKCKETQIKFLDYLRQSKQLNEENTLYLIGPGRLYDFNTDVFAKAVSTFTFFDADPSGIPYWNIFRKTLPKTKTLNFEIGDITGVTELWINRFSNQLSAALSPHKKTGNIPRWGMILDILRGIPIHETEKTNGSNPLPPSKFVTAIKPFSIVSLNVLSQLPLYLQDQISLLLQTYFPKRFLEEHESDWLNAFNEVGILLINQHLRDLACSGAKALLIIYDAEYANYYGEVKYSARKSEPPPLTLTKNADGSCVWVKNPDILNNNFRLELTPANCGLPVDNLKTIKKVFPNYQMILQDTWLWHITPQGIEDADLGTLHRVCANALVLRSLT